MPNRHWRFCSEKLCEARLAEARIEQRDATGSAFGERQGEIRRDEALAVSGIERNDSDRPHAAPLTGLLERKAEIAIAFADQRLGREMEHHFGLSFFERCPQLLQIGQISPSICSQQLPD